MIRSARFLQKTNNKETKTMKPTQYHEKKPCKRQMYLYQKLIYPLDNM